MEIDVKTIHQPKVCQHTAPPLSSDVEIQPPADIQN